MECYKNCIVWGFSVRLQISKYFQLPKQTAFWNFASLTFLFVLFFWASVYKLGIQINVSTDRMSEVANKLVKWLPEIHIL